MHPSQINKVNIVDGANLLSFVDNNDGLMLPSDISMLLEVSYFFNVQNYKMFIDLTSLHMRGCLKASFLLNIAWCFFCIKMSVLGRFRRTGATAYFHLRYDYEYN